MIGLVDCASFYCSCERAFRPDLQDVPIIVLSNNDHWIIALNAEAKALGLKRGMRFKESRSCIDKNNVVFFSSNYTLYNDMSWRFIETLRELSPVVEPYSIDEAFIDLSGMSNLSAYGEAIRETVKRYTRLPTAVGIAPTKALAKAAQRLAKQRDGCLLLDSPERIARALEDTPVDDIWGIGRSFAEKLTAEGVRTAADFIKVPEWKVKKNLTSAGWVLQQELKGIPMAGLKEEPNPRKGIISARQFGSPVKHLAVLQEALSYYTELAVEKLRAQHCTASMVTVSLEAAGTAGRSSCEVQATDYLPDLISAAKLLLKKIYSPEAEYWRTTVYLFGIEPVDGRQLKFFDETNVKTEYLKEKVDEINSRYGQHTVHPCASEFRNEWGMRRDYISPNYTTSMRDFPAARVLNEVR